MQLPTTTEFLKIQGLEIGNQGAVARDGDFLRHRFRHNGIINRIDRGNTTGRYINQWTVKAAFRPINAAERQIATGRDGKFLRKTFGQIRRHPGNRDTTSLRSIGLLRMRAVVERQCWSDRGCGRARDGLIGVRRQRDVSASNRSHRFPQQGRANDQTLWHTGDHHITGFSGGAHNRDSERRVRIDWPCQDLTRQHRLGAPVACRSRRCAILLGQRRQQHIPHIITWHTRGHQSPDSGAQQYLCACSIRWINRRGRRLRPGGSCGLPHACKVPLRSRQAPLIATDQLPPLIEAIKVACSPLQ